MICLDTSIVIPFFNNPRSPVRTRLETALAEGAVVAVSSLVLYELWYGVEKSVSHSRNADRISDFVAGTIQLLPFDSDDAREAGEIRAALEHARTPIGSYDILIAAQARRRGALLVTANTREFARVPGLRLEDWAAATPDPSA